MASASPAVAVSGLRKSNGDVQALDGVTFEVRRGEIFGLVGPNGAGKTTTLRTLATALYVGGLGFMQLSVGNSLGGGPSRSGGRTTC